MLWQIYASKLELKSASRLRAPLLHRRPFIGNVNCKRRCSETREDRYDGHRSGEKQPRNPVRSENRYPFYEEDNGMSRPRFKHFAVVRQTLLCVKKEKPEKVIVQNRRAVKSLCRAGCGFRCLCAKCAA